MKKITFFISTLLLIPIQFSFGQWTKICENTYVTNSFLIHQDKIIAGTFGAGVFLSSDGGISWEPLNNGLTNQRIHKIKLLNNYLFAATDEGIYRSSDFGTNWEPVNNGIPLVIVNDLTYTNGNLFAITNFSVYKSTNNGNIWESTNNGLPGYPVSLSSIAEINSNLFLSTYTEGVFKSTDYGLNWVNCSNGLSGFALFALDILADDSKLFIVTVDGIYMTDNYGQNWIAKNLGIENKNSRKIFLFGEYLVLCTDTDGIYLSTNNGGSWLEISDGLNNAISMIVNNNFLIAAENTGRIWRRTFSSNGTLILESNPDNSGILNGDGNFNIGDNVVISALPNSGNLFLNWSYGDNILSNQSEYNFIFTGNITITANFIVPPEKPLAISASDLSQTTFIANWNQVNNAEGYYLDVSIDNQFINILSQYNNINIGDVTQYQVRNLLPNTNFYYRVRSYNTVGISDYSNIIEVKTLPLPPIAPIANQASEISETSFIANWNQFSDAEGYYLDVAIDNQFINKLINYDNKDVGNVNHHLVDNLINDFTYFYRIRAYNIGGLSGFSNFVSVNLNTEIEQSYTFPDSYQLNQNYPNPFNPYTKIQFDLPKTSFVSLKVYDTLGRYITTLIYKELRAGEHEIDFNGSNLSGGIYFYKLQADDFTQTRKMILIK